MVFWEYVGHINGFGGVFLLFNVFLPGFWQTLF